MFWQVNSLDKAKNSAREDGTEQGRENIDHRLQRHGARLYGHARGKEWTISQRLVNPVRG